MTATAVRRVILGTAGHIDHGKSSLVERLTGERTDRLKEERERGMTIDVGYAAFALDDGTEVGLLDVPGHERLVRTMVAAATAVDLVLLVVAADDGPMPQTREHVQILDLLGVTRVVVAITKIDLADEETIEIVEEETRDLLQRTGIPAAPMVRVSSATGEGLDLLRRSIADALPPARDTEADDLRAFRMPILRAFVAEGRGAVVTGIPLAGRVREGDGVEILPPGWTGRVRGIEVHKRGAVEARPHRRTALALSDVAAGKIRRGMVVCQAGAVLPARRFAVRLRLLAEQGPLEARSRVRFHVGAGQWEARLHLLEARALEPGGTTIGELETFEDVVALPGDRFVVRAENASATLGGGVVVAVLPARLPRRRTGLVAAFLEQSEHLDDPRALLMTELRRAGEAGARPAEIARATGLLPRALEAAVEAMVLADEALRLGHARDLWILRSAFDEVRRRLEAGAAKLHAKDEALRHLPVSLVRTAAGRVSPAVLDAALDDLVARGRLVREGKDALRLASHEASLSPEDQREVDQLRAALRRGGAQPPLVEDLEADLGLSRPRVLRALKILKTRGEAFQAGDLWFDGAWVESAKERLARLARERGGFTPSDARTLLGSTRKWVIPLLEAFDRSGFTRRSGDRRQIRASS